MFRHREEELIEPRTRSVRVAVLTVLALSIFSVVFFRLWYLEVLSGDHYRELANDNRIREIRVQPPRGNILDRDGKILVDNRGEMVLQARPVEMPKPGSAERKAELQRLEQLTGMSPGQINRELARGESQFVGGPVTLREGLGMRKVFYLREHSEQFPGVTVERAFRRNYKQGALGAHLFGQVGEVTADQLREPRYAGLQQGDLVGQSGIEYEYDRFLRGRPGAARISVDALGRTRGQLASQPARAGENVRLAIDSDLQATGEEALGSFGLPGAFVALNPDNGQVVALGSAPTFDPSIFTKAISERRYRELTSREYDAPLANRAIQGLYPTGSTFKPITATAALEQKLISPNEIVVDAGKIKVGDQIFKNAQDAVFGPVDMSEALKVSSDVYFYKLGLEAKAHKDGGQIQDWARDLGLGERTGIDLPAEQEGLVPTPAWRNKLYRDREELNCDLCPDRPWSVGDNINLAVGQGDLQADPLQMAVAYSAIANGGDIVTPHVGMQVESVTGEVLEEIEPPPKRHLDISETTLNVIREGLRRAAMEQGGTSYPVFGNFPFDVMGKTGTAERGTTESGYPLPDQSWYVAMAPANDPQLVVAVTIERGGFGADSAAPVAARMLESYFKIGLVPAPAAGEATLDE
jgi:penicillin-binding protein 2